MAAMHKEVPSALLDGDPESPTKEIPDDEEHTRRPTSFRLATVAAAILGLIVFAGAAVTYSRSDNLPHKAMLWKPLVSTLKNTDSDGEDISQKVDKSTNTFTGDMTVNHGVEKSCSHNNLIDCTGKCQWDSSIHSCRAKGVSEQHFCERLHSMTDCKKTGFCDWQILSKHNGWVALCQESCEHALENLLGTDVVKCTQGNCQTTDNACPAKAVTLEQIAGACPEGRLTEIVLSQCEVTGDIASLSHQTNLVKLSLYKTKVTGDIASLSHLKNLEQLWLAHTKVSGDIASLSHLKNLELISLQRTKVTGDIDSLSNLKNL